MVRFDQESLGFYLLLFLFLWCVCIYLANKIYFRWGRDRPNAYRVRIGDNSHGSSIMNSESALVTNAQIADTNSDLTESDLRIDHRKQFIFQTKMPVDHFFPSCKYSTMKMQLIKLKTRKYLVKECVICLEKVNNTDLCKMLSCFHIFHAECVSDWLVSKGNCPLCTKTFTK